MKKIMLSITMCLLFVSFLQAQKSGFSIENLMGGGSIAYAKPMGDFSEYAKGGIGYSGILGYNINENLTVGGEVNRAATLSLGGASLVDLYGLTTVLAKGWYKFSTKKVKPFVGVGVGLANFEEPDVIFTTTDADGVQSETTVEGSSRVGLGANLEAGISIRGVILSYSFMINGKSAKEPVFNEAVADLGINYHRIGIGYLYNF